MIKSQNEENKEFLSKFELPFNDDILNTASHELDQFKNFLNYLLKMNQSCLTNQISYAENMAFRVLGSIDWTKSNFDEIKQFIDPVVNTQHLNLNHMISKENGKFLQLKQNEVHEAIHEWSYWRLKLNKLLISNPSIFISGDICDEKKQKQVCSKKTIKKIQKTQKRC